MKGGEIRTTGKYELPKTKRAKAPPGARLHLWQLVKIASGVATYRCAVCDFKDDCKYPHTPEPREPYCPADREAIRRQYASAL